MVGTLTLMLVLSLAQREVEPAGLSVGPLCSIERLPGLRGQRLRAVRESTAARGTAPPSQALDPPRAADFSLVATAVLGRAADTVVPTIVGPRERTDVSPTDLPIPCDADVRRRDALAWRMTLTGFSAREIADVVAGHLELADVQQARARLMAGRRRADVVAFIEARWNDRLPGTPPLPARPAPALRPRAVVLAGLEPDLAALSAQHGLPTDLVRAVIAAESGGNPRAVSPAGAIGLMQLMPATAAALGVNPWLPRENLRGGIAYLSSMLRAFGNDLRLALIAYNAGPQHARAVRDGRAVAYRETRAYVEAVSARFPVR